MLAMAIVLLAVLLSYVVASSPYDGPTGNLSVLSRPRARSMFDGAARRAPGRRPFACLGAAPLPARWPVEPSPAHPNNEQRSPVQSSCPASSQPGSGDSVCKTLGIWQAHAQTAVGCRIPAQLLRLRPPGPLCSTAQPPPNASRRCIAPSGPAHTAALQVHSFARAYIESSA